MLLHEALARTGLTRKAVEYYIDQGLISPKAQENGYRTFSPQDISRLEQIAAYRKLGVSIPDIQSILSGNQKQVLSHLLLKRTLAAQREQKKDELLARLAAGASITDLSAQLDVLDAQETIAQKLLLAFPGHFGQYFALHFAHFLQSPIQTDEQRQALDTIIAWLDHLPPLELPAELRTFLEEATQDLAVHQMEDMHAAVLSVSENPAAYLKAHEDAIHAYMTIRNTEEYKASPAARLMENMKSFQQKNGYNDVFIPAMETLSPAYALYRIRLKAADEALAAMLSGKPEASYTITKPPR